MFDPEEYTISVRKERIDGDLFYVARVGEFPNLAAFEETPEEARAVILDAISALQEVAAEKSEELPAPSSMEQEAFSGRFTLRLPKSLHAKMYRLAEREGVSLNQLFVTAIAGYAGEVSGGEVTASRLIRHLATLPSLISMSLTWPVNEARRVLLKSDSTYMRLPNRDALVITSPAQTEPHVFSIHTPAMQ